MITIELTVPSTKGNSLMIFTKIIHVYCKSQTKGVNTLCGPKFIIVKVKANGMWLSMCSRGAQVFESYTNLPQINFNTSELSVNRNDL